MNTITVSDLRRNLKEILESAKQGKEYHITQRGKIIVTLTKAKIDEEEDFNQRIKGYKNGGIEITSDIVDAPLKELDYIDDSLYNTPPINPSIAAEPDV